MSWPQRNPAAGRSGLRGKPLTGDVAVLLEKLLKVIDQKKDTIRIYRLGGTMPRVERFGKEGPITTKDVMIV
jgi:CRISPR/Cas system-associated endoribonuclease Cas2